MSAHFKDLFCKGDLNVGGELCANDMPIGASLTAASNITSKTVLCYKVGKFVVLSCSFTNAAAIAAGTTIYSGAPAPAANWYCSAATTNNLPGEIGITTAGNVYAVNVALPAGTWYFSIMYPIN